jgi:hypothetical protein
MRLLFLALIMASLASSTRAQTFEQTLISTTRNINIQSWETTAQSITPDCPVKWSVRKLVLHGGKQEGVDLIVLDNGKLQITVIPTRGMGILNVVRGDLRLGWDSPVKEVVHPRHINLQSRGGLGWLEGFNEWMVRCGLEYNGHPGTDKFINNVGAEATMELTLHGKIENIPAQEVEIRIDKQAPYRIHIRGRVDERMFYGPKLEMWTDLSTEPGSDTFRVSDEITNQGASEQEFQMLYHINFGRPLLEEGATMVAAIDRITPFNDNAAKGLDTYATYAGPKLGFIEQVYCIRPLPDKDGSAIAMLQNAKKDRAVSIAFSTKELPYLTQWKNTAAEADGYVTGIEPGTGYAYNRRIEREAGRVGKLAPGAKFNATLNFAIHATQADVKTMSDYIQQLQGDHKITVDQKPAAVE